MNWTFVLLLLPLTGFGVFGFCFLLDTFVSKVGFWDQTLALDLLGRSLSVSYISPAHSPDTLKLDFHKDSVDTEEYTAYFP